MKILLLTSDIDGPGVGFDAKYSKKVTENPDDIYVFHFGKRNDLEKKIYSLNKKNIFNSFLKFKKIYEEEKIDLAHIRGFIGIDQFIWIIFLIIIRAKYIVTLSSQLNTYNLNNKLFFKNPDINNLKKNKKNDLNIINSIKNKIYEIIIPIIKKIYLFCFGNFFINKSKGIIVNSNYELTFAKKYKVKKRIIYEPFFDEQKEKTNHTDDFEFDKSKVNIVYWGRIDYEMKGLDRLIEFAKKIFNKKNYNNVKIHLMGPNYNFGLEKIEMEIKKNNLSDIIQIHPKEIWSKSNQPLKKADYSILLAKWDGSPRSLRESINFNIPIIISEETNFEDLVKSTNCGIVLKKNNTKEINIFIKNLISKNYTIMNKHKESCNEAKKMISNDYYRKTILNFYYEI
jgi:hypothetical protein